MILTGRDMEKKHLAAATHISTYTVNKLTRDENVNTDTLVSVCRALGCTFDDNMELLPDEKRQPDQSRD